MLARTDSNERSPTNHDAIRNVAQTGWSRKCHSGNQETLIGSPDRHLQPVFLESYGLSGIIHVMLQITPGI